VVSLPEVNALMACDVFDREDVRWMRLALKLAKKMKGQTAPNPCVGAVLVKDGELIASGYHRGAGTPHAEVVALKRAGERAVGSTLYVTLEPCCHYGRTPPCVDSIISAKVKRVVVATIDPNPLVNGKGIEKLLEAGVEVKVGVLEREAKTLIEDFAKYITTGMPFVTLKLASSLDGKIATKLGDARWITSEASRKIAHMLRREHSAVMVGINTAINDDPELTVRLVKATRQPIRIVVDSKAKLPPSSKLCKTLDEAPLWLATTKHADKRRLEELERLGVKILIVDDEDGKVEMVSLMRKLGEMGVMSLLIEGGGEVAWSALKANIVDRVVWFIAPIIIGGRDAKHSVGGEGVEKVSEAFKLQDVKVRRIGCEVLIDGRLRVADMP
jgi:diaminohydroxyphosphoribosylaminopyrimidine deaminase/5-amino-6-(5-phosphoribosylamino)uracil reductase